MHAKTPTHGLRAALRGKQQKGAAVLLEPEGPEAIEALQLARLARTVLNKSCDDIAALSEANPSLVWEWIEAFAAKKREADADSKMWSAAVASLTTAGALSSQQTAAE